MITDATTPVRKRNNVSVTGNPAGRPIVFAHGFGCSSEMWSQVAPQFEDDYLVVRFDHVGAGASDLSAYDAGKYDSLHGYADDVLEILEDLDLTDVVFVGHSVSAMIGVLATTQDAGRFGALVLVGPSPRYVNTENYTGGFEQEDIDSLLDALDANYLGWSAAMAPLIMGHSSRPELGESLTESFCRTDPTIAGHFARVTFLSDNRHDLPNVTTPTLVLQCQEDIIAPLPVGQYVHRSIPGSTLVVLEATGHCPNLSAPDELTTQIKAYLR
ncbi:alpha/beta fold hydrolase [Mycetocola zhujimingii]|uniref:Alpha/beta hydrolase n=1 Tax=Mycetocola zhujimingii TaxID=2079792 RepID=A0A2U1TFA6_9MICO|nr:alpha/beta hydrolase [Mycetocola zhujimingii]AWB85701.1 alpha/beta hydrolase [Mycetocola zhujimingii]PWC07556.1 alpha/beta hydrolase [Mycetocola zhujimingii]